MGITKIKINYSDNLWKNIHKFTNKLCLEESIYIDTNFIIKYIFYSDNLKNKVVTFLRDVNSNKFIKIIVNKKEQCLLCYIKNNKFKGYDKNLNFMYKGMNENYKIIPKIYNVDIIHNSNGKNIYLMYSLQY